jgi:hypothetical protein
MAYYNWCYWISVLVQNLVLLKGDNNSETGFLFYPQVKRWGVPIHWCPLERANLSHWTSD